MNKKLLTTMLVAMTSLFAVARTAGDHTHPVPHTNNGRSAARAGRQAQPRQARAPRAPRAPRALRAPRPPRMYRGYAAPRIIYAGGVAQPYYVVQANTQLVAPATATTQPVYVYNQTVQSAGTGSTVEQAQLNAAAAQPVITKVSSDTNGWTKIVGQCLIDSQGKVILPKEYQQFHVDNVRE